VEDTIGSALTFHRLPRQHRNHKSIPMLGRLNGELRQLPRAESSFPNAARCLHLVRTLGRNARSVARRQPISEHGCDARTPKGAAQESLGPQNHDAYLHNLTDTTKMIDFVLSRETDLPDLTSAMLKCDRLRGRR
jgi:hypothetical protein